VRAKRKARKLKRKVKRSAKKLKLTLLEKQTALLVALFLGLAFVSIHPVGLSLINQDAPLVGAVSVGDFLTLFSVFGTCATLIVFFVRRKSSRRR
jgi:hypothetical protein